MATWRKDVKEDEGDGGSLASEVGGGEGMAKFLHKYVPVLHDYFFITIMAGGLVVLSEMKPPHKTNMLNPFHRKARPF
uniref:Uncharacterized protein n=1 Tax=Oryza punctata TaxID=4537 RepID=A0A0E0LVA4_ORYPU